MSFAEEFPFTSHYLEIDGRRLHYIDEGGTDKASKPVLLMVHGNPTWTFYWRNLIKAFRQDYRVIAIDHMGCGMSDKPQDYPYRLANHIDNLEHLTRALDLKQVTLFVHDWGGAIGMGWAARNRDRVRGFIVFNTAAFPAKRMPLRIAMCRIPGFGKLAIQGLNGFAKAAITQATAKKMSPEVKQGYLRPYDSFANRIAHYRFVQDIPMKPSHPSWKTLTQVEQGLKTLVDRPMLLLWGEQDWCFDMSFLEGWCKRFPSAEVKTFADAGHYVVEDAAPQIITEVRHFLQRNAWN